MKQYLTFKNLFIAVCLVIIAILLLRGCRGTTDRAKELKKISDSVAASYSKRIGEFDTREKQLKDSLALVKLKSDSATLERNRASSLLRQSNSRAAELALKLANAKKDNDTTIYVLACDSLGNIVTSQEDLIAELMTAIEQTDSLMVYETSIRDQVIELLQNKFVACDSAYGGEKKRFNQLYADLRPRNAIFIGGEISGSAITPFNQVGVVGSLLSKGGKLYQVGGGLQVTGGYYIKIGASFKIKLRK